MLCLVFILVLVQTGAGEESSCCQHKTVGVHFYTLIYNHTGQIPSNCKNNCTYERNDQDGSRYCFAAGENQVQCHPGSVDELYYPEVHLKNNYDDTVSGTIHYPLCSNDDYTEAPGGTFKNSRGACLITKITGTSISGGYECTPYSSSGTSYSKFAIIEALNGGCTITRIVN